jgi:hypothetical protein
MVLPATVTVSLIPHGFTFSWIYSTLFQFQLYYFRLMCLKTLEVGVCIGPGLAFGPGPGSTDDIWVWARFGLSSNDSNQTLYKTFQALSDLFFSKEIFTVALTLCS